jgi:cellulose synthase/poly-beta-1,6-N-acetylglucosamine synthase-like glycosyltransferase
MVFLVTAAVFALAALSTLVHQRHVRRLPPLDTLPPLPPTPTTALGPPTCSIVIAARDEAARVEATVRHALAQREVTLEIIVVDDRSVDGTSEILQRLAADDTRVRALRVDALPDGWLGKCHACHVGASVARGEWLLFTDADCWLQPDVLARALRVAARDHADHITMTPGVAGGTLGAQAWHLVFLASVANWISGVNTDRPKAHFGIGAFNLVRAAAYRESGGYDALRLTIIDDIRLGLLLERAGTRTRAFLGGPDVECHWGTTVRGMFRIMEKNYFAATDFKLTPVIAGVLIIALFTGLAVVGPLTGTWAGLAAGLAAWSLSIPAAVFARRLGWSIAPALIAPFFYPVIFAAAVNSAIVTVRQGGVRWRDTFYPLDALRKGAVRPRP